MCKILSCCLLLLLAAASARAQAQIDVHLEKTRYLAGEPVVLVMDVLNVGDEPFGYAAGGNVRLTVAGIARRLPPGILGCYVGASYGIGGVDHPPLLQPRQSTSFRYLLQDYDLPPGSYELTAAGRADLRWKYYDAPRTSDAPPPPPRHQDNDPVPGAEFERTLPFEIAAATEAELKTVLAPLLQAADGPDLLRRSEARAALIESAPPFLVSVIARFAEQDHPGAIDALGRMSTTGSRAHLKNLFRTGNPSRNPQVVLAVARAENRDDADFFAAALEDVSLDDRSRIYAAHALGRLGGDRAVRDLERALPTASERLVDAIVTALGNTRSRAAGPVIIGMFGNNPARNTVCSALRALTHQFWCDGTDTDPAAMRRQWLRRWDEDRARIRIFGPDPCRTDPTDSPTAPVKPIVVRRDRPAPSGPPTIIAPNPGFAARNTIVTVTGHDFGLEERKSVRVFFKQGSVERPADLGSAGWVDYSSGRTYHLDVRVPADLTPGRWELILEANGRPSEPIPVVVDSTVDFLVRRISPTRPHPSQLVRLSTGPFAQVVEFIDLTDANGRQWRLRTGNSGEEVGFRLPDDAAAGDASVRAGRIENGVERLSDPFRFPITVGPSPLKTLAVEGMTAVAAGQWTDLGRDHEIEYEINRSERIDIEFRQGAVVVISPVTGLNRRHVQVPGRLKPGEAQIRTRTWIGETSSEWSQPAVFRVLAVAVPPSNVVILAGPLQQLLWPSGTPGAIVEAVAGEQLVLLGHFPVRGAAQLRVQLRGARGMLELPAADVDGGVRVVIPRQAAGADWRVIVATRDGRTAPHEIAAIRVVGSKE